MIKVFQKIICNVNGDCMRAAIASLFEMKYEDVPNFSEEEKRTESLWNLIHKKGFKRNGMLHNHINKNKIVKEFFIGELHKHSGINSYFYASVYSPKYFDKEEFEKYGTASTHAVIIDKDYNIVHDPNPANKIGIVYPMSEELGYNGIINITLINNT